jgi:uncharacterized protein involved in cysteine biosynthesis
MSEIKGQLLGVLLVLMLFGTVAGVLVSVFNQLTQKVEDKVTQVGEDLDVISPKLLHY